jgi:ankyrin repeat protein
VTPAVAALAGRYFELAQVLHRNGSSVEAPGGSGNTPLHSAAFRGDLEMVEVLLEYGVAIDAQNSYCCTPLSGAAIGYHNNPRVARLLIERGADPNIRDSSGFTPLHYASQWWKIEIARVLVEHGANIEVKDNKGRTPLDIALEGQSRQCEEIVKLLLEHGARRREDVALYPNTTTSMTTHIIGTLLKSRQYYT